MATASLAFTSVVTPSNTPGGTPNTAAPSKVGQVWIPQEAKKAGNNWYLRGGSGWWPATANRWAGIAGRPVQIQPSAGFGNGTSLVSQPAIYAGYEGPYDGVVEGPYWIPVMNFRTRVMNHDPNN